MVAPLAFAPGEHVPTADQRIVLVGVPWSRYEIEVVLRGEASVPRLAYLGGALEFMTPSKDHERLTSYIGRLIEVFADLHGVDLSPYRSWTLTSGAGRVGCEPDECYLVGDDQSRSLPDLVVEVIWTSGGLDKLAIYQHLGVREVWFWQGGVITAHVLRAGGYARTPISEVMPGLDVEVLASYLDRPTVSAAKRDYRAHLRARR
jgi:Uma2 family endonuclease